MARPVKFVQVSAALARDGEVELICAVDENGRGWYLRDASAEKWRPLPPHPEAGSAEIDPPEVR